MHNHEHGNLWTLLQKEQVRNDITNEVLLNIPEHKKGCVDVPLIDCVEISSYIIPILHIMIGLGNKVRDQFFSWVDVKVEVIPEAERKLRVEWERKNQDLQLQQQQLQLWYNDNSGGLADKMMNRKIANTWAVQKLEDDSGCFEFSAEERKEFKTA